jgi:Ceramidase
MTRNQKYWILGLVTLVTLIAIFLLSPVAQPPSFHHFADDRSLWGIPNFGNVVSNLPFLIVALIGLAQVSKAAVTPAIRATYTLLFIGVLLTGLGSAYYHWNPNNDTLVWDRIPMTIVFMSLLAATLAELVSRPLGIRLLVPLVAVGVGSVLWWHFTETQGRGDLRLYYWVQFYPMLALPLILWLFYTVSVKPILRCLIWVVFWYVIAKVLEQLDYQIYGLSGVSGHTLKHLAAAVSTWYFVLLFRKEYVNSAAAGFVDII